jgi:hypothetical protein
MSERSESQGGPSIIEAKPHIAEQLTRGTEVAGHFDEHAGDDQDR